MTIDEFAESADLIGATELQRIALLSFYRLEDEGVTEFTPADLGPILLALHLPEPNYSRLVKKMIPSGWFVRGSKAASFRLHAAKRKEYAAMYGGLISKPTEVKSDSSILPNTMLSEKRTYLQRFAKQVNAAYSAGIFDGCAVLMRRLLEVSLIHVFENVRCLAEIEIAPGRYKDLKVIIDIAEKHSKLGLSKEALECLAIFRELGNLSAHRLHYNCHPEEIDKVKHKFRLVIEELFSRAGKCVEK